MSPEEVHELRKWLQSQIDTAGKIVQDAQFSCNYGKSAVHQGMVDAFKKCLTKID